MFEDLIPRLVRAAVSSDDDNDATAAVQPSFATRPRRVLGDGDAATTVMPRLQPPPVDAVSAARTTAPALALAPRMVESPPGAPPLAPPLPDDNDRPRRVGPPPIDDPITQAQRELPELEDPNNQGHPKHLGWKGWAMRALRVPLEGLAGWGGRGNMGVLPALIYEMSGRGDQDRYDAKVAERAGQIQYGRDYHNAEEQRDVELGLKQSQTIHNVAEAHNLEANANNPVLHETPLEHRRRFALTNGAPVTQDDVELFGYPTEFLGKPLPPKEKTKLQRANTAGGLMNYNPDTGRLSPALDDKGNPVFSADGEWTRDPTGREQYGYATPNGFTPAPNVMREPAPRYEPVPTQSPAQIRQQLAKKFGNPDDVVPTDAYTANREKVEARAAEIAANDPNGNISDPAEFSTLSDGQRNAYIEKAATEFGFHEFQKRRDSKAWKDAETALQAGSDANRGKKQRVPAPALTPNLKQASGPEDATPDKLPTVIQRNRDAAKRWAEMGRQGIPEAERRKRGAIPEAEAEANIAAFRRDLGIQ